MVSCFSNLTIHRTLCYACLLLNNSISRWCCCSPMSPEMAECNELSFIFGLIMFPGTFNSSSGAFDLDRAYQSVMNLVTKYSTGELHTLFHQPAVAVLSHSTSGDFSFCDNTCALLVTEEAGNVGGYSITPAYYQLTNGSCHDSFTSNNW